MAIECQIDFFQSLYLFGSEGAPFSIVPTTGMSSIPESLGGQGEPMIAIQSSDDTTKDLWQGPCSGRKGFEVFVKVFTRDIVGEQDAFGCLAASFLNVSQNWI